MSSDFNQIAEIPQLLLRGAKKLSILNEALYKLHFILSKKYWTINSQQGNYYVKE